MLQVLNDYDVNDDHHLLDAASLPAGYSSALALASEPAGLSAPPADPDAAVLVHGDPNLANDKIVRQSNTKAQAAIRKDRKQCPNMSNIAFIHIRGSWNAVWWQALAEGPKKIEEYMNDVITKLKTRRSLCNL